jgi:hypothetical protein
MMFHSYSATRFAVVTTAALPFNELYEIIPEEKIHLSVKRHRGGHICNKYLETRQIYFLT